MLPGMRSRSDSENSKVAPAMIDGQSMGSTTWNRVRPVLPPRSADASSNESGTRSNPAKIGRITYGSQRYDSVMTTAGSPYPGPSIPNGASSQFRMPSSDSTD